MRVSFGTRLEPDLKQRVKIYAAATDRTIEDVVEAALSGYLPSISAEARAEGQQRGPGAGTPRPQVSDQSLAKESR